MSAFAKCVRALVLIIFCTGLASCAGFRAGVESVAYIDSPEETTGKPRTGFLLSHYLNWNDIQIAVELNNKLQTRDHTVMLFVVPTSVDPFDKFMGANDSNKLLAHVEIKSANPLYVFDPSKAGFMMDGKLHVPVKVTEYAQWDENGRINKATGKWGYREVTTLRALQDPQHNYSFRLEFDLQRPSPREENYQLDLSRALQPPGGGQGPVVKFKSMPWKQGYT